MDRAKNYDDLKKKIINDLKKHKPKLYSEKTYQNSKGISLTEKVYKPKIYEAEQ